LRQQRRGVGVGSFFRYRQSRHGSERPIAHWRWRRAAQWLADRHGDRFGRRQWFGVRLAVTAEGERLRDADRAHAQTPEQTALRRADKQHAVSMGQALEHFEHLLLRRLVEVDQQVAAEHEIEGWLARQQCRIEDIADLPAHLLANVFVDPVAVLLRHEMPIAKLQILPAKRVLAVNSTARLVHRQRADVHAVDLELMRLQSGIKQGHGNRVGFFTGRARQAEDAQRAHVVQLGETLTGQFAQGGEGFRITEKPRFRNDHRFDQRLLFIPRALQQLPVFVGVGGLGQRGALAHGALDDRRAHRRDIEADAFLEEIEKALLIAHGCASSCAGSRGGSGNSKLRTASSSKSLTRTHCSNPCASSRTGPRYGASRLSRP